MSTEKGGQYAFPFVWQAEGTEPGMTLRDYFAAKAMQALISNSNYDDTFSNFSKFAYEMADAMLAEGDV